MTILERIFEAGVVGCGGAGFPTHAKLGGKGIRHLILNGAECEPLLGTDRWLMRHRAGDIVEAAAALAGELGAEDCTIALKKTYTREIAALEEAIRERGAPVALHKMESFYPAGDEQVMVYEVTGRVVPPAGIPLDVGAAVTNVATACAVRDAMEGRPFTHKYLTVAGAVREPLVLRVPVGTSFGDCVRLAGGALPERWIAVSGGPMMGKALTMEEAMASHVTKTTSGILVLPEDGYLGSARRISLEHMKNRAAAACIQCSYCTQLCPRYLLGHPLEPHKIMRKMAVSPDVTQLLDDPDIRRAALCCQCGVCEIYACPMGLQPRRVNAMLKEALAGAGIRYPKGEGEFTPRPDRKSRRVPTRRAAARAGVLDYYGQELERLEEYAPARVVLALDPQIGAPCQPVVREGDQVALGQLVARCPEGKLGANLHASIAGAVVKAEGAIVIQEGRS